MRLVYLLIFLPVFVACASVAAPSRSQGSLPTGMGALEGTVVRGPISPVGGIDRPDSVPVTGANVIVSLPGGRHVKSTVTDSAGKYSLVLTPGTYVVTVGPVEGAQFSKDVPATVNVAEGQVKVLDIRLDTGIR